MLRNILAVIVGVVAAVLTVIMMEQISHTIYPLPEGVDVKDSAAMSAHLAATPMAALLLVLSGFLMATFDGVLVAGLVGRAAPKIYALLIGVLMLAGTVSNFFMFRHPMWFMVSSIVGIIVFAWLAAKLAEMLRARLQIAQ